LSFAEIFGNRKLSLRDPMFSRFSRTQTCVGQTDRQTHDDGIYRTSTAFRGENGRKLDTRGYQQALTA